MNNNLPKRKSIRMKEYDYNSPGAYFITICTENRQQILSRIVGGDVLDAPKNAELLPHGIIADKYINQLNEFYDSITVDRYVIMPNHIHIMLLVFEHGASRTSPPTKQHSAVSQFVSTFKRFCNKEYGGNIWQRHFHDHIIRDHEDYTAHIQYIRENPRQWQYDELNADKIPVSTPK
ncbi:MAG: hypothetical protein E7662_06500 [Ruminococcaceae bacterium]|nr:hypothetical protein [Oscillospiraceae bacterium]